LNATGDDTVLLPLPLLNTRPISSKSCEYSSSSTSDTIELLLVLRREALLLSNFTNNEASARLARVASALE
tara:strand:- start:899 stop:1111 length:213 start_codon:yes stop_codon:yes gene_type:complete